MVALPWLTDAEKRRTKQMADGRRKEADKAIDMPRAALFPAGDFES